MPIQAVHAMTKFHHPKEEELGFDLSIFDNDCSRDNLEFSKEVKDRCVAFLRRKFMKFVSSSSNFKSFHNPNDSQHYLPVTSFHIGLLYSEEFVREMISELHEDEIHFVLTALIDYEEVHVEDKSRENLEVHCIGVDAVVDWTSKTLENNLPLSPHLPLALAICNGDRTFMQYLMDKGANVLQVDANGKNIIHCLVDLSDRHPNKAISKYHMLMAMITDKPMRQKLLLSPSNDGQNPLEYAAAKCLPEMMHAIINSQDVYKFLIRHCGTHIHSLYDVTHDEIEMEARGLSLLQHLSVATEKQLARIDNYHLLEQEPFQTWIKVKEQSNLWHTRFWMVMWSLYVLMYIVSVVWYGESKKDVPSSYHITMLVVSYSFALMEIKNLYVNFPYLKMVIRKMMTGMFPLTVASTYRIFQSFFILTMIISCSKHAFSGACKADGTMELILHVVNIFCGFMSVMFFTQLSEAMGHYLTVIEKMLFNTIAFLSIWCVIFLAFATSFYVNSIDYHCMTANGTSSNNTASSEAFSSIYHSIYETFLLVLAVVAPKSWYFSESNDPDLSVVLYTACLIINTLVLLNLLIAIMNERVVEICRHKHSILKVNQLSIYLIIGDRRKSDQQFWKRYKALAKWTDTHRLFQCSKDKTKIFLHVVERTREC